MQKKEEVMPVKEKTLWITKTAMLLALLIVLQAATRGFGQLITGSFVNALLALSALTVGLSGGIMIAVISPFLAFVLGIGPQLLPIVPAIAAGNVVFVVILWAFSHNHLKEKKRSLLAWCVSAICKFLTLYAIVVQLLCHVLPLKEAQIVTFSTMFSWPQLFTALIGGGIALLLAPKLPSTVC